MNKISIAKLDRLKDRKPEYALVGEVDLVIIRFDDGASVFLRALPSPRCNYGRWFC